MRLRARASIHACAVVAASAVLGMASSVRAQDVVDQPRAPEPARSAAGEGAYLPQTLPASLGRGAAFGYTSGGYDSSRRGPLVDSAVEVTIWGPVAVRAQATYSNDTNRMRPGVSGRVQVLRQERAGIDGAVTVSYKAEGFTETEGEVETSLSVGRRFRSVTVVGNVVYGQDPEGNERDGEVHAAAFRRAGWLFYGFDSRVRFAIGAQRGGAATSEPALDIQGGPVVMAASGPVAFFAQLGPSLFELADGPSHLGVAALGGIGAAY